MIPEDARLVMSGWREKQPTIALVCRLYRLDMATICKVILVTDTAIGLINSKFVLDLSDPEIGVPGILNLAKFLS